MLPCYKLAFMLYTQLLLWKSVPDFEHVLRRIVKSLISSTISIAVLFANILTTTGLLLRSRDQCMSGSNGKENLLCYKKIKIKFCRSNNI